MASPNDAGLASAATDNEARKIVCYSACNFDPLSWGIGVQN